MKSKTIHHSQLAVGPAGIIRFRKQVAGNHLIESADAGQTINVDQHDSSKNERLKSYNADSAYALWALKL